MLCTVRTRPAGVRLRALPALKIGKTFVSFPDRTVVITPMWYSPNGVDLHLVMVGVHDVRTVLRITSRSTPGSSLL